MADGQTPDGFVYEELAEFLLARGDAKSAQQCFARAHQILSKDPYLNEHEPARIERLAELSSGENQC